MFSLGSGTGAPVVDKIAEGYWQDYPITEQEAQMFADPWAAAKSMEAEEGDSASEENDDDKGGGGASGSGNNAEGDRGGKGSGPSTQQSPKKSNTKEAGKKSCKEQRGQSAFAGIRLRRAR